jgi:hypothetical protein
VRFSSPFQDDDIDHLIIRSMKETVNLAEVLIVESNACMYNHLGIEKPTVSRNLASVYSIIDSPIVPVAMVNSIPSNPSNPY